MSSIANKIGDTFGEQIKGVKVVHDYLHGEEATGVTVYLLDGRFVEGTFSKNPRKSFGGVQFSGPKPVADLMIAKVRAVLDGTAEEALAKSTTNGV